MQQEDRQQLIQKALEQARSRSKSPKAQHSPKRSFDAVHLAAALRSDFTIDSLKKDAETLSPEIRGIAQGSTDQVLKQSRYVVDPKRKSLRWQLEDRNRREILDWFVEQPDQVLRSSISQLETRSGVESMRVSLLTGDSPDWQQSSNLTKLHNLLHVAHELKGVVEVPATDQLKNRIEWLETLRPMQLLTENFKGREKELETLRSYIDFLPSDNLKEWGKRLFERGLNLVRRFISMQDHPPLVISGLGGVGKSALVSKFILDHVGETTNDRSDIPLIFVYLDYEHHPISLREPLEVLREAARQLALQFPELSEDFLDLETRVHDLMRNINLGGATGPISKDNYRSQAKSFRQMEQESAENSAYDERESLLTRLAEIWDRLPETHQNAPFMLVLDSFEAVDRLGQGPVNELYDFLMLWSRYVPRFRPVLSGRTEVAYLSHQPRKLPLQAFDRKSGEAYLEARGVKDPLLRQFIFSEVGGNPLILKLAAEFVRRKRQDPARNLDDPRASELLRQEIMRELTKEHLFRRNLDHIHDPEARKIAFPGLVVRRVSPEIIEKVLAGPCGLKKVDADEAKRLFGILRQETFLVTETGEEELEFRPDLRQLVLQMVLDEKPGRTRQILDNAVAYFTREGKTIQDRADLIYYRMLRGDAPSSVDELLEEPALDNFLSGALEELPGAAHIHLANRWGIRVPNRIMEEANDAEWEAQMAAEIESLLGGSYTESSLRYIEKRLGERKNRKRTPSSPLFFREAQFWAEMGNLKKARSALILAKRTPKFRQDLSEKVRVNFQDALLQERLGNYGNAESASVNSLTTIGTPLPREFYIQAIAVNIRLHARKKTLSDQMVGRISQLLIMLRQSETVLGPEDSWTLLGNVLAPLKSVSAFDSKRYALIIHELRGLRFSESLPEAVRKSLRLSPQGFIAMLNDPDFGVHPEIQFHYDDWDFAIKLSAIEKKFPNLRALNEASYEVFGERLGNFVEGAIYPTALYNFLLAVERYLLFDRLDAALRK